MARAEVRRGFRRVDPAALGPRLSHPLAAPTPSGADAKPARGINPQMPARTLCSRHSPGAAALPPFAAAPIPTARKKQKAAECRWDVYRVFRGDDRGRQVRVGLSGYLGRGNCADLALARAIGVTQPWEGKSGAGDSHGDTGFSMKRWDSGGLPLSWRKWRGC